MPTSSGWSLLVGCVLTYAAGWALGSRELVTLSLAGWLPLVLAFLWTLYRPRLEAARRLEPSRVEREGVAFCEVRLTNVGRRATGRVLGRDRVGEEEVEIEFPSIRRDQQHASRYRLPTSRRGVFDVGPLSFVRSDPLGLMARRQHWTEEVRLWVHPVVHPVLPLAAGRRRDAEGARADQQLAGGTTFHALRDYVYGDDIRQIHWRSSARSGTLVVRQNIDTSQPRTVLVLDERPASYDDDESFERAVEAAASVAVSNLRACLPVELLTTGGRAVRSERPAEDIARFLEILTCAVRSDDEAAIHRTATAVARVRDPSTLVFVTAALRLEDLAAVTRMAERFRQTFVIEVAHDVPPPPVRLGSKPARRVAAKDMGTFRAAWDAQVTHS